LRRFTRKLAVAVLAVVGGYWAAQTVTPLLTERATNAQSATLAATASAASTPPPAVDSTAALVASGDGEKLIASVLDSLERRPNVAAKIRQSMRIGGDRFAGEGNYWQQGVGNLRRARWELKTLLGADEAFVTQICDGDHVWTDCKLPGERKVTRIDVARVRRELAAEGIQSSLEGQGRAAPVEFRGELLVRGGASQLIADLHSLFQFGEEQTLRHGDRTVRAVIGRWRPEALERVWPGLNSASIGGWPEHLPHHVLVHIDNDDLFPYLVEYRSGAQASLATSAANCFPSHEPLASFEFIDVQFAVAMPAELFQFSPAETDWHDVTAGAIERLRPPPKAEEPSTARRPASWR
jgi:hypothetical protein